MSYFLFGTFNVSWDEKKAQQVKAYGKNKNIYILFNEETDFYKDIYTMLIEQNSNGKIKFAVSSANQPCNSSDVLFPFDKFTNEVLFEDKTGGFFNKCCKENIDILFDCLKKMFDLFHIVQCEIFIVEGYDDVFRRKICSLDEMKRDILCQIKESASIESCIYCLS